MSARRRRSRGGWIPQLAHDVALALCGFVHLVALIAIVAFIGDAMGVLEAAAVAAVPVRGRLLASIVRRFRADMAVAAGLPEYPQPPLAETLARLDEMHARVQEMIAAAPPRTERTRAGDREGVA